MGTHKVIDNTGVFHGGYFILNPERVGSNLVPEGEILSTLSGNNSLKREIISLIRDSKESIKICSFILTDQEVFNELKIVLDKSEVAIFIITQLDDSKFSTSFLTDEEILENKNQSHLDFIKKLFSIGAHIRAAQSAHAKFVVSDRTRAIVMSSNITNLSLNLNPETGFYIDDNETIVDLDRLFDIVFQSGTQYTKFLNASKNKQFIVTRNIQMENNDFSAFSNNFLRYTYEKLHNSLYASMVKIIQNAEGDLWVSTYNIVGLENLPELVSSIRLFLNRHGRIKILCRGMFNRQDHLKSCTELVKMGCEIYGDIYNHSKGIESNGQGMFFTANIDGYHGLKNGFEVGVITNNNQTLDLQGFIRWQIKSSPFKLTINPTKLEYFDSYNFYCAKKSIIPLQTISNLNIKLEGDAIELFDKIENSPVYVHISQKKIVQASVGSINYKAGLKENILTISERIKQPIYSMESHLLEYIALTINK